MKRATYLVVMLSMPWLALGAGTASSDYKAAINSKPDPINGEALFEYCTSCHGPDGSGDVSGSIPRIAGQHYRVLVRQIVDFRYGKRWDVRMEGIAAKHTLLATSRTLPTWRPS